jgi:hypothetical protein
MIKRARPQMPTVEEVRANLYFTHATDFLLNPTDIAQELAERDEIRAKSIILIGEEGSSMMPIELLVATIILPWSEYKE